MPTTRDQLMSARGTQPRFLRHAADRRSVGLLLACSAVYAAHWILPGASLWLIAGSCVLAISACVVKHNHIHTPTFRAPMLNRGLNVWLALLTGTSTTGIRTAHNQRHHRTSQTADDFVRCSLVKERGPASALLSYCGLVIAETWRHAAEDIARLRKRSPSLHRLLAIERAAIWTLAIGALVIDWQKFLIVFALPWLFSQWFLITINLLQHDGLEGRGDLLESRNVKGVLSNWIFLNNGYHTAHHIRPALHWSLLGEYHRSELTAQIPDNLVSPSLPALLTDWWEDRSQRITMEASS
ncbi:MAG: fatty acid desaturase family protein [Chthoniobacteraceae bacterium]